MGDERAAAFAAAARRYVAAVESAPEREPELLLGDLAAVLPVMYEAALRLPDVAREITSHRTRRA